MSFKDFMIEKEKHEKSNKKSTMKSASDHPKSKLIGELLGGTKIYLVDGEYVRDKLNTAFIGGGHGYVYSFIPKDEILLEKTLSEDDYHKIFVHELVEKILMKYADYSYDDAHNYANSAENFIRANPHNVQD